MFQTSISEMLRYISMARLFEKVWIWVNMVGAMLLLLLVIYSIPFKLGRGNNDLTYVALLKFNFRITLICRICQVTLMMVPIAYLFLGVKSLKSAK